MAPASRNLSGQFRAQGQLGRAEEALDEEPVVGLVDDALAERITCRRSPRPHDQAALVGGPQVARMTL